MTTFVTEANFILKYIFFYFLSLVAFILLSG